MSASSVICDTCCKVAEKMIAEGKNAYKKRVREESLKKQKKDAISLNENTRLSFK